ncbi:MAG: hypothetical protein M0P64_00485 [Candidatus Pacebacteria bacterium]|jgi:hypothetical protein|nr:hypothetical protein [Candidatus Paceibacterota bacterium]
MLSTVIPAIILALLAGLLVKYILEKKGGEEQITAFELKLGAAVIAFIVAPLVGYIGWEVSRSNQIVYNEYWNGWEIAAERNDVSCTRDGPCYWEYDCDPYLVYVSRTCTRPGKNGGTYECGGYETRYHSCPYVTVETTYNVRTTLGGYTVAPHRFPDDPQSHRWRTSKSIPDSTISNAGVGIPKFWNEVWMRIASGTPNPATTRKEYKNYILANEGTILKQHSANIEHYLKQGLLPPVTASVVGLYGSNKVYFVGHRPGNATVWQSTLEHLNAAFGTELQGDLHVVIVQNDAVNADYDTYVLALKAYWQDNKVFGRDAFGKNGVAVILGTNDGKTVAWARAFTGMPRGNEHMIVALESGLKGQLLDSTIVLGTITPTSVVSKSPSSVSLRITKTDRTGIVPRIIWGDDDKSFRFERIGMTGKGSGKGSGYLYLYGEIQPTDTQKKWIGFFVFLFSCVFWFIAAAQDISNTRKSSRY